MKSNNKFNIPINTEFNYLPDEIFHSIRYFRLGRYYSSYGRYKLDKAFGIFLLIKHKNMKSNNKFNIPINTDINNNIGDCIDNIYTNYYNDRNISRFINSTSFGIYLYINYHDSYLYSI